VTRTSRVREMPVNATSANEALAIARDLFRTQAPEGVTLRGAAVVSTEPVRDFARVAASVPKPTACYVLKVSYEVSPAVLPVAVPKEQS
jgi:hypothetical protein